MRHLLGYQRIENRELIKDINELYRAANLLSNFFSATRKLTFKERRGSKYYKRYDNAATPSDRLLASEHVSEPQKVFLTEVKTNIDPYKLRRLIDSKQERILGTLR